MLLGSLPAIFGLLSEAAGANESWIELKSENFVVYSDADEEKVRRLVVELELFRKVLGAITSADVSRADMPLMVVATKDERGIQRLYGGGALGVHYCTIYRCMAIADLTDPETLYDSSGKLVLFHEFVHNFLDVYSELNYPNWYHEGFAEFLASMSVDDGIVTVGLPAYHRLAALSQGLWIPIREVMESSGYLYDTGNSGQGILMFYAESWLIVHYLHSRADRRKQLQDYLEAFDRGVDPNDAFETVFQMTGLELQKEITDYIWSEQLPYFRYDLSDARYQPQIEVRQLSELESKLVKAKTQIHFGTRQANRRARGNLKDILKVEPDSWEALSVKAEYLLKDDKIDDAQELLNKAITDGPNDANALAMLGYAQLKRAREAKGGEKRREYLDSSRNFCKQASSLNSNIALAHYCYAAGYLLERQPVPHNALSAMETAFQLRPQLESYLYDYGLLLLKAGEVDKAKSALRRVSHWASSHYQAYKARNIVKDIEEGRIKPVSAYMQ